jgi:tetratricopeptide (TPR) repeat protein
MRVHGWPTAKLKDALREAPTTVTALIAIALFVLWATDQSGYPVTHWAPGGLILLALLAIALSNVRLPLREIPIAVRVALTCLALYTLLSFLSVAWAGVPADAWEGANRTLLYLLVFALFALWSQRGASAALLLGTWMLAMVALAGFVMVHVDTASNLGGLFSEGRLKYPGGYENASAAAWAMVAWPALLLAESDRIAWGIRGLLAGGTVLLVELSLLSESRGMLYATALTLILVFALFPGRLRRFVVLLPVAAGVALSTPSVLSVGDRLLHGGNAKAAIHGATAATFAAAVVVAAVVALGAAVESRRAFSPSSALRIRRAVGVLAVASLVAVVAGGWVAVGDPVARVRHGWDTFKSKSGYAANGAGNRLTSGLGSQRYDFYRVAIDEFLAHPLVGIGADNFQQQYLRHRRSDETPHYPHSVELRTLTQTGVLGALLGLLGLGAALFAGARAGLSRTGRRTDPLGAAVAAAALGGFTYWLVHGSFDWFWEFAGLGAPAFALLGLACALGRPPCGPASERVRRASATAPVRRLTWRRAGIAGGVVVALAGAGSLTAPWLSQLQVQSAARIWTTAPRMAYARLQDAARLNPLSDEAYLVAGSIALRFGDLVRADHEFSLALARTPRDSYALLERGAIASTRGEPRRALGLLERAMRSNPREALTRRAVLLAREGRHVNIQQLNRSILLEAQRLR